MLRSPLTRLLLAVVALVLIYLLGVLVRTHYGVCVDIRNSSSETVRQVSVRAESGGETNSVPDLAPGDHRRAYVRPTEKSQITLTITDGRNQTRDIDVFDDAEPGECGVAAVEIQPGHRTETVETHQSVCWKGWFDFM